VTSARKFTPNQRFTSGLGDHVSWVPPGRAASRCRERLVARVAFTTLERQTCHTQTHPALPFPYSCPHIVRTVSSSTGGTGPAPNASGTLLNFTLRNLASARLSGHVYIHGKDSAAPGLYLDLCAPPTLIRELAHITHCPAFEYAAGAADDQAWNSGNQLRGRWI
jgi:hypothetical protein